MRRDKMGNGKTQIFCRGKIRTRKGEEMERREMRKPKIFCREKITTRKRKEREEMRRRKPKNPNLL